MLKVKDFPPKRHSHTTPISTKLFFMWSTFNLFMFGMPCRKSKKASHLHKKDIAPTIKGQRVERGKAKRDQPFFRLQLAFKCKQPAFYANDIRKNWHSGRLKSDGKYLNCRFHFSLCRECLKSFHPGTKMVKISIFMLGLKEGCRKY